MPTSSAEDRERGATLRVDGLHAGYGRSAVIREVDLSVAAGEIVAVIGPNGAGKSTLLKAITGLINRLAGRITLDGEDIAGLRPDLIARRGIGYVPQVRDVFVPLSVREN